MYQIGDIVKCRVSGFKEYGIFAKVDDGYIGLIHISEITQSFVHNVTDYAEIGEEIYAKVIGIDETIKHLKLSIKNINYKKDGRKMSTTSRDGFKPLKEHLNIWIDEKLKEMNKQEE